MGMKNRLVYLREPCRISLDLGNHKISLQHIQSFQAEARLYQVNIYLPKQWGSSTQMFSLQHFQAKSRLYQVNIYMFPSGLYMVFNYLMLLFSTFHSIAPVILIFFSFYNNIHFYEISCYFRYICLSLSVVSCRYIVLL